MVRQLYSPCFAVFVLNDILRTGQVHRDKITEEIRYFRLYLLIE